MAPTAASFAAFPFLSKHQLIVPNARVPEDPKDNAKFRQNADAAKESIREYFSNWRGQEKIVHEESYVEIEKAIRALVSFYSKAGPSAALPESVKSEILDDLKTAEEFL
ncbi:unnamed protein product [Linum tenue]|uniref:Uncharacterized protein n=1 Tax=Linum tenue TaxID=586396 RepID=A0AAV0RT27_9ROSI|nr:unnamed protein product [Linum tenue]